MATKSKLGSARQFGARYGRTVKHNWAKITAELRKPKKCPYCSKLAVKRQAVGIWFCKKCGAKFTARAYTSAIASLTSATDEKEKEA
ncbi:MAG: 50S ribosomal protein L37ae [Candidatus Woesearchaeota archaeon]